jgi:hypothetical protein
MPTSTGQSAIEMRDQYLPSQAAHQKALSGSVSHSTLLACSLFKRARQDSNLQPADSKSGVPVLA